MNNKTALFVALVLATLSVLGLHFYIQKIEDRNKRSVELLEVLVAASSMSEGQKITEGNIVSRQLPADSVITFGNTPITDKEGLIGGTLQKKIVEGQVFQTYHLTNEKQIKTFELETQFRAVTIPVGLSAGLAGMLQPGDWVDIAGTVTDKNAAFGDTAIPQYTGIMLEHILILAVDQRTSREAGDFRFGYKTVTLRATPEQAVQLIHISNVGSMYLLKSHKSVPTTREVHSTSTALICEGLLRDVKQQMSRRGIKPRGK